MTATKTTAPSKAKPAPKDAIALLKADHQEVSQLFAKYEKTRSVSNKKALVAEICTALSVHAQVKASSLDMVELGARMAARKDDLLALAA